MCPELTRALLLAVVSATWQAGQFPVVWEPCGCIVTGNVLVHAVQWGNPAVAYAHERDPVAAHAAHAALLAPAVGRRALLATAHLPEPFVDPPVMRG